MSERKKSNPAAPQVYKLFGSGDKAHGEDHGRAKLTEEAVREARRLFVARVPLVDIARVLDVNAGTLSKAIRGLTWSHIADPPPIPHRSDRNNVDLFAAAEAFGLGPKRKKG